METMLPPDVLDALAAQALRHDAGPEWPTDAWQRLTAAGVPGWSIPPAFGGQGRGPRELLVGYRELAGACLTTAFILSQREAAVRRIVDLAGEELKRELLRPLACGGRFATVGLSQLTTSRQHTAPALAARLTERHLELDGVIPWVTGADQADHIVIGATLDDNRQVLAVLPGDTPGVSVSEPLELMALQGSRTAEVRCAGVKLDRRWLLAGPAVQVMAGGRGGTGGLETSCLALGLSATAIRHVMNESAARAELRDNANRLQAAWERLWNRLLTLAETGSDPAAAAALRAEANQLVLQATQSALTASKGTGFLRNHPAQLWARQALFFLVWSCPRPATEATLSFLAPDEICSS